MTVIVSLSLTDATDDILDRMAKKTGLARSEIVRRLIIAHCAEQESTSILPETPDRDALTIWKAIPK